MFTLIFSVLNAAQQATKATTNYNMPSIAKTLSQFFPFILIIIIFYFFLIRPQNKQREILNNMINNLQEDDKVITKGGIIAKIDKVMENNLIVELYDGTKIEILKHAVISIINENSK